MGNQQKKDKFNSNGKVDAKYENDKFIVFHNSEDENIQYLITTLETRTNEIMNFFGLKKLSKKMTVKIYYSLEEYKNHLVPYLEENGEEYYEWMIADTYDDNINMLELNLCQELNSHKNDTIQDYIENILHEFGHICHHELLGENNSHGHTWFSEALATNVSGQDYSGHIINCTYKELKDDFNSASNNYSTAYLMGKFMLEHYGRDFVLNLIRNWKLLDEYGPILFEETKSFYN